MKKDARKILLLETAIDLFGEYGYEMVSMQQIADAADILPMQLYRDFTSKSQLLDDVLDYFKDYLQHYQVSADSIISQLEDGKTPEEILMPFITYYERYPQKEHAKILKMLFTGMFSNERMRETGMEVLFKIPAANIAYALKVLAMVGAIPPCNHVHLSILWTIGAIVFALVEPVPEKGDGLAMYTSCMRIFILMAVRGVKQLDIEVTPQWNTHLLAKELTIPASSTKLRILRESLRLFSEYGYNSVTNKDIATAAGLQASSALYRHFKSKSDIMDALVERQMQGYARYNASRPPWQGAIDPDEQLPVILNLFATHPPSQEEQVLYTYRLLFRHRYFHNRQMKDFFNSMILSDCEMMTGILKNSAARGSIPEELIADVAAAFVFGVCGLTIAQTMFPTQTDHYEEVRKNCLNLMISVLLNGFAT